MINSVRGVGADGIPSYHRCRGQRVAFWACAPDIARGRGAVLNGALSPALRSDTWSPGHGWMTAESALLLEFERSVIALVASVSMRKRSLVTLVKLLVFV